MRNYIRTIFTTLVLLSVYASLMQTNAAAADVDYKVALEHIVECEPVNAEIIPDILLSNDITMFSLTSGLLPSSKMDHILQSPLQEILKPPLFT